MNFHPDKCKVMYTGKNNLSYTCRRLGSELAITTQEMQLGVIVDKSSKMLVHCTVAIKKAKKLLGIHYERNRKQNAKHHYDTV